MAGPNTLYTTLLENDPVVTPTKVVVKVNFPPASPGTAYTTGGDYVDIRASKQLDPSLLGSVGPNLNLPITVSVNNLGTAGSYAEWVPGTTLLNGKLQLFDANGSEFSGNYASPWVTGNVVLIISLNPSDR